jgi:hypothetical protein
MSLILPTFRAFGTIPDPITPAHVRVGLGPR